MKKQLFLLALWSIMVLSLFGCFSNDKNFYQDRGDWGLMKIPIIPPCYAGSTSGIDGPWYLTDCIDDFTAIKTVAFDVCDTVIVSYFFEKYIVVPEKRDTIWDIIIPSEKVHYSYKFKPDFDKKLLTYTQEKPNFRSCQDLRKESVEKGYLDWFPEKYK